MSLAELFGVVSGWLAFLWHYPIAWERLVWIPVICGVLCLAVWWLWIALGLVSDLGGYLRKRLTGVSGER